MHKLEFKNDLLYTSVSLSHECKTVIINGDDYIKLQDELYKDMPLDELFNAAESNWN